MKNALTVPSVRLLFSSVIPLACLPQARITCVIASLSEVKKQQARCAVFFFFSAKR